MKPQLLFILLSITYSVRVHAQPIDLIDSFLTATDSMIGMFQDSSQVIQMKHTNRRSKSLIYKVIDNEAYYLSCKIKYKRYGKKEVYQIKQRDGGSTKTILSMVIINDTRHVIKRTHFAPMSTFLKYKEEVLYDETTFLRKSLINNGTLNSTFSWQ